MIFTVYKLHQVNSEPELDIWSTMGNSGRPPYLYAKKVTRQR